MPRPKASRTKNGPRSAQRDSLDFRDWIYEPVLRSLPEFVLPPREWIHVLHQGQEGACTGFGLAAVINYLIRARAGAASERVSARMLYEMAKRHDRWPGYRYDGSTARGAVKGWYKNGVCLEEHWPYVLDDPGERTEQARESALAYPAGAFYRILPRRSDVHAALLETGIVFVSAATHKGWDAPEDGMIPYDPKWKEQGGHAFAIVGYTEEGFLIQNSWGEDWGRVRFNESQHPEYPGCALWSYPDFDDRVWDLWVAQLARPVESIDALAHSADRRASYSKNQPARKKAPPRAAIADHFLHIDDGQFDPQGDFWSNEAQAQRIVQEAVSGGARHLLLYAHGGLNTVKGAARRVARWRPVFQANGVHELHFIWETGLLAELRDLLFGKQDFVQGRAGGPTEWVDAWLERTTGSIGRGLWAEMREDAQRAFVDGPVGGASVAAGTRTLQLLRDALASVPQPARPQLHLAAHSAGSLLFGHLLERWRSLGGGTAQADFQNLVLLAPSCSHAFFASHLKPALAARAVERLWHFQLDDETEQDDDVALVYRKSLLYLVSRAYQKKGEVVPLMGLLKDLPNLDTQGVSNRIRHYNTRDDRDKTQADGHTDFDDDPVTLNQLLSIVLGGAPTRPFREDDLAD